MTPCLPFFSVTKENTKFSSKLVLSFPYSERNQGYYDKQDVVSGPKVGCVCVCMFVHVLNQKMGWEYKPETSLLNMLGIFLWVAAIIIIIHITPINTMLFVSSCVKCYLSVHMYMTGFIFTTN